MLAALGEQMLRIAGTRTDGTILWCVGPKTIEHHIAPQINEAAAGAGRPAPAIVCSIPCWVTDEPAKAASSSARSSPTTPNLPSYRAMLDIEGIHGLEDLSLVGSEAEVRDGIAAVAASGATDFTAVVMGANPDETAATRALLAVSDRGTGDVVVRLIATDLDGTLLGPGAVLAERTHRRARTGAATQESTWWPPPAGPGVRRRSVLGPTVGDPSTPSAPTVRSTTTAASERVVRTDPVERSAVGRAPRAVLDTVDGAGLGWELADGTFGWDDRFLAHNPVLDERRRPRAGRAASRSTTRPAEVLKLMVSCPDLGEDELYRACSIRCCPTDVETTASGISFVEITGAGRAQGQGPRSRCATTCRIDAADVVAFGDNRNDLAMIEWAGTGYAMANANPALAEVADDEAPHHAEHGVAQVIESLLA